MKNHPILRRFMKRKASVLGAVILILFFAAMNVILFRSFIFKKLKKESVKSGK